MEVGESVLALDLVDTELDLAECMVLSSTLEVSKRDLKDTSLERVGSILETGGAVDKSLSNITVLKDGRSL